MRDDYIVDSSYRPEDRVIRKIYTPKEVVHTIKKVFRIIIDRSDLSYTDKLLLQRAFNELIWWFTDD